MELIDQYSLVLISLIVPVSDHLSCTTGGRLRESLLYLV